MRAASRPPLRPFLRLPRLDSGVNFAGPAGGWNPFVAGGGGEAGWAVSGLDGRSVSGEVLINPDSSGIERQQFQVAIKLQAGRQVGDPKLVQLNLGPVERLLGLDHLLRQGGGVAGAA